MVMLGSLNERMGRTLGFAFWAVEFAHFSISWSVIGRPVDDNAESVFVMFNLRRTKMVKMM